MLFPDFFKFSRPNFQNKKLQFFLKLKKKEKKKEKKQHLQALTQGARVAEDPQLSRFLS